MALDNVDIIRRVLSLVQMAFTLMNTIVLGQKSADVQQYNIVSAYGANYYIVTDKEQVDFENCRVYSSQSSAQSDLNDLSTLQTNSFGLIISIINCIFNCLRSLLQAIYGKKIQGRNGEVFIFIEAYQTILSFFSYAFANVQVGFRQNCVSYVISPLLTFYVTIFLLVLTISCSVQVITSIKGQAGITNKNLKNSFIVYTIILVARVLIRGLQTLMKKIEEEREQNWKIFFIVVYILAVGLGISYIIFCFFLFIALFTQADAKVMVSTLLSSITGQAGVIFEKFYNNEEITNQVYNFATNQ